jgi:nicotinate-nucleotide adenylyltransferase
LKIAVFGGAFDPPHEGHTNLVRAVREQIRPDKFIIIPTGNAPHKSTQTDFATRFAWAQTAFADCEVSDIEDNPNISYTIDTVRELCIRYPSSELFLVIGSDMLMSFEQWRDWREILELCTVVAAAREPSRIAQYREHAQRLGIKFIDIPIIEMSSSLLREER